MCNCSEQEQARAVAMDFATRLSTVHTTEQAIVAAEALLNWLRPPSASATIHAINGNQQGSPT